MADWSRGALLSAGLLVIASTSSAVRAEESAYIGRRPPEIAQPLPLPPLARETQAHFETSYWRAPAEKQRRLTQLNEVTAAWRTATKNESNDRRLHVWLRMAIRNSMPGSREPLPPVPSFERPWSPDEASVAAEAREAEAAELAPDSDGGDDAMRPVTKVTPTSKRNLPDNRSSGDPFRDDPSPDWGTAWGELGD
jgi:hypothetical protein